MGENITDENFNYIETSKNKYSLCGLSELTGFKGHKYDEGKDTLNDIKKDLIKKYEFEIIRIDERLNSDSNFVDMFIRLNQNPCPISKNSFEMWNSYDVVRTIKRIKEIAKYTLFKQSGNKMKEEEIVTTLAFINLKNIDIKHINEFFSVFTYIENKDKANEHLEVKVSIKCKDAISNYLKKLVPNSDDEEEFLECVNSVNDFVNKLKILSEGNDEKLIRIFNPNVPNAKKGSKKDFYIVFLILQELDNHIIETYKEAILKDLKDIFILMKNMPNEGEATQFIKHIEGVVNKYKEYSIK